MMLRLLRVVLLSDSTVVFDLDDTLYQEVDYQESGYNAISDLCFLLYKKDVSKEIERAVDDNADVLSSVCDFLNLSEDSKESFLWIYRLHEPNIKLSNEVKECISKISRKANYKAIISDGREVSQRRKLCSLGIDDWPAFISETWGEVKPGKKRFAHVMTSMPSLNYIYIGDNVKKDFITPNELGWITVGIKNSGLNIHSQDICCPENYQPSLWVDSISELSTIFPDLSE